MSTKGDFQELLIIMSHTCCSKIKKVIILIIVSEKYGLSKNTSLSKYTVVYSKLFTRTIFFVGNVFIANTFPVPHYRSNNCFEVKFPHLIFKQKS